jgi:hypothetical protein
MHLCFIHLQELHRGFILCGIVSFYLHVKIKREMPRISAKAWHCLSCRTREATPRTLLNGVRGKQLKVDGVLCKVLVRFVCFEAN